ncbi:MAG: Do family serine endopeptidase [Alphaproteobacteria bacterium]
MKQLRSVIISALVASSALLIAGPGTAQQASNDLVPESQAEITLSFAPIVRQVAPSVVNIYTKKVVRTQQRRSPLFDDPFFRRFFGQRPNGSNGQSVPQERVQSSLGSGVVVGADGVIITNNHVIKGADEVIVALSDRREFEAEIVLADERTDLAVLRIDTAGETLPAIQFGDPDAIDVGDLVVAIGNPFGVGQTVTSGIVSALARTQVGVADYQFFIQTDAAINPGNSGGALVNVRGELIGVNTAIYSRSGGSVGIGFAIPSTMVRSVVAAALGDGMLKRPWLGANGQPVTSEIATGLGLDRPGGVLLNELYPDGPADQAGLRVGDVVLTVDGQDVFDMQAIKFRLAASEKSKPINIAYWRDGATKSTRLQRATPPETPARDERQLVGDHPLTNVTIANLSPAFAEELGRDPLESGVVVVRLSRGSYAARRGLRPGDVLASLNGQSIKTSVELEQKLAAHQGDWHFAVSRGDRILNFKTRAK